LSICYGIVTEHGGTITVRNVQPRGAKFTIELPYHAAEESREAKTRGGVLSSREGRVLLVDEDSSVLEAVVAMLRGSHHNVRAASTLDEAKAALGEQEFDVVVADMRVMGNTALAGLRAWLDGNRPALLQRLVLMRASTPSGPAGEKAQAGFRILQKPFKAGELLAAIEAALSDVHAAPIER
jgi:DNA-binding NtrC family response regulator